MNGVYRIDEISRSTQAPSVTVLRAIINLYELTSFGWGSSRVSDPHAAPVGGSSGAVR